MLTCLAMGVGVCDVALAESYTVVIPPQYDEVSDFSEGLAAIRIGEKWGFIDKAGKEVVPPQYDGVWDFREGLAAVMICDGETEKWGFIDTTGKEIVPPQYGWVGGVFVDEGGFYGGLAMVWVGDGEREDFRRGEGKWGFIDRIGREVVPVEYDRVGAFREGRAAVMKDGMVGFVDETGAVVIPLTYAYESDGSSFVAWYQDIMPYFSEGLAAVCDGDVESGPYGYIDRDGNVVIPFEYSYAAPFSQGLAYVSEGGVLATYNRYDDDIAGKYGFIDKTGAVAVPLEYDCDYVHPGIILEEYFRDGFARVSKRAEEPEGMRYGMVDRTGKVVVPIEYGWALPFSDGRALVGFGWDFHSWGQWGSCGLVDETGKEIVSVGVYDIIEPFSEGFARVWSEDHRGEYRFRDFDNGTHGYIDIAGNEVIPCIFEDARDFSEGLAAVLLDGKWGFIAIME